MYQKILKNIGLISFLPILILGIISRLNILSNSSIWFDEAFSGVMVREDLNGVFSIIAQDRVHPPLYYLLLKLWTLIFGNTEFTIKGFSLVFGIALIIAAYYLIKKLVGTKAALITSGIFSLSPFFILYSLEARSYIMLALEALVAVVLFLKIYSTKSKDVKTLINLRYFKYLVVVSILMIFTHYLSIPLILSFGVFFILKLFPKLEKIMWIGTVAVLALILFKGIINNGDYRIFPKNITHTSWLSDAQPLEISEVLYSFMFGLDNQAIAKQPVFKFNFIENLTPVFIVLLVIVIVFILRGFDDKNKIAKAISKLLLFNILAVTIVSLFGINIFLPRYLIFLSVVFVVWVGVYVSRQDLKFIITSAVIYLLLLTQLNWVNSNKVFNNIEELRAGADSSRRIVVESPFDYLVLKYYLNDHRNLYFLDSDYWHMKETPWSFFRRSQITDFTTDSDLRP